MTGPLTKSRFKLALDCPTKLHYAKATNGYRNKNDGNEFLAALADGGHQVGALAKFRHHPDPYGAQITVDALDKEESIRQTKVRLQQPGRVVIAEAAIAYETYFVRVDKGRDFVEDFSNRRDICRGAAARHKAMTVGRPSIAKAARHGAKAACFSCRAQSAACRPSLCTFRRQHG